MGSHRITVIDDSPEILDVLGDALRREGVEVTLLGPSVTYDEIAVTAPDVLMVDLRLGTDHLPGWEIVRGIRSHQALLEVPVIVCSAALDQMRAYGGSAVGTRTYLLPKPFSLDDLESVMAEALGAQAAGDERAALPIDVAPDCARDPGAWFAWVEDEMLSSRWSQRVADVEPKTWISEHGHPWRVVRTARGVEVRPELVSPFLRYGNLPMVSALGLAEEIEVELTTHQARWVGRFAPGSFDLPSLGMAMLDERKLPHDNLSQLFPSSRRGGLPVPTASAERATFSIGTPAGPALQR